jgi:hypothetical protein
MLNPYAKAALFVLRLAACGLIILGGGLCAPDVYLYLSHRPAARPAALALKAVPALAGAALYARSKAVALRLTKDLD